MARIKGVDIPNNKRIEIALTYIYGIGRSLSNTILEDAKVDKNKRAGELSNDELNAIRDEVNKYMTEGDLRREVNMNIKTKMEINSYQGTRHKKNLPVRGQRTNRNARTRKGRGKVAADAGMKTVDVFVKGLGAGRESAIRSLATVFPLPLRVRAFLFVLCPLTGNPFL